MTTSNGKEATASSLLSASIRDMATSDETTTDTSKLNSAECLNRSFNRLQTRISPRNRLINPNSTSTAPTGHRHSHHHCSHHSHQQQQHVRKQQHQQPSKGPRSVVQRISNTANTNSNSNNNNDSRSASIQSDSKDSVVEISKSFSDDGTQNTNAENGGKPRSFEDEHHQNHLHQLLKRKMMMKNHLYK